MEKSTFDLLIDLGFDCLYAVILINATSCRKLVALLRVNQTRWKRLSFLLRHFERREKSQNKVLLCNRFLSALEMTVEGMQKDSSVQRGYPLPWKRTIPLPKYNNWNFIFSGNIVSLPRK